jgi:hypothetical protein
MTKSLFRALLAIAGAVLLGVSALPAAAATLTYNDPNCAGFQITGSGGSFTLTCAKLSCSISGVTNPTTAQDTTLTATCTPGGASYLWSLVTGPFSHASCNSPTSPTAATTAVVKPTGIAAGQSRSCLYQVTGTAAPLSGQAMVTVTWSDAPPTPPVCTPSGVTTPAPITSAGGTIALNANCAPSAGLTYTWTRTAPTAGAPTNASTATPSDTLAANTGASGVVYTWQVVACSSPGVCDTKTVSVTVPAPGGGGGGADCSSQGFVHTRFIDIGWPASGTSWNTIAMGGFGTNDALVIKFTPPAGSASAVNQVGSISLAEYGDPLTGRYAVLSTSACDFNGTGGAFTVPALQVSSTISWSLQVGRKDAGPYVQLNAGTSYYLNLKNRSSDGVSPTCASGSCNMVINWLKPPGT